MQLSLVLVNGIPGTGKTTLARKLTKDLGMPCLGKDMLKEFLFDTLGVGDLTWSQTLGGATFRMLYEFIDHMLTRGESIIIECPFYADAARPVIAKTLKATNARLVEVYCTTDPAVRRQRFIDRNESGDRHPGHVDQNYYLAQANATEPTKYPPLDLGTLIKVDTTSFGEADYQVLLQRVRAALQ
ncbi:MAG TPA: ATP-binding protein [Candidatus Saccharimonadales bacterium]|jgi:predicted kinase|nr:ATP-binding protein [Candidatus Saccharimonadales bacterium]